jgi:hypothetical protein
MGADNYYRISALPALGDLGSEPPLSLAALREHVSDRPAARVLVDALLLFDDLRQREAFLAGELKEVSPVVLTPAEVRNEEPLPQFLTAEEGVSRRVAADTVWAAYFKHAAGVAARRGSEFLAGWISREVAMRNALAAARARALGLDPAPYLVAPELVRDDEDSSALISKWAAAPDPLAGARVLDRARWAWLHEHDAWFSFGDEELAAYAAKLMLIVRWYQLTKAR